MQITLTPEQAMWLQTRVADGWFGSVEEAARILLDERIAAREVDGDLSRARPFVEEGQRALERGETISLAELKARNAERLAALSR